MCLIAVAWKAHPRYPLILLGNRDEFHARPSVAADWWPEAPDVFGGRDLKAGGSWLGVSRGGRIAVVTNNPLRPPTAVGRSVIPPFPRRPNSSNWVSTAPLSTLTPSPDPRSSARPNPRLSPGTRPPLRPTQP